MIIYISISNFDIDIRRNESFEMLDKYSDIMSSSLEDEFCFSFSRDQLLTVNSSLLHNFTSFHEEKKKKIHRKNGICLSEVNDRLII